MDASKTLTLFESADHKNLLFPEFGVDGDLAVQANQYMIMHGTEAMILDPGGHKVYSKVLGEVFTQLGRGKLASIVLSHQDPDIVAAINGWLTTTDAVAYASALWTRFIPHFGLDHLMGERLHAVPDEGQWVDVGGAPIALLPAHFLHSCGNLQVFDPTSKILYTGDLGASLGMEYRQVPDFDAHLQYMEGFHRRYMAGSAVMKAWADMVRPLDIEIIAPQHGALFKGKEMVNRFIDWSTTFECGVDVIGEKFVVPPQP